MGVSVRVNDYYASWECDDCHKRAQTTGDKLDRMEVETVPPPDGWRTKPKTDDYDTYCEECGRVGAVLAYCPECSAKRDEDLAKRMELYKALQAMGKDHGMFWMDGLLPVAYIGTSSAGTESLMVTSGEPPVVSGSGFNPYPRLPEPEW